MQADQSTHSAWLALGGAICGWVLKTIVTLVGFRNAREHRILTAIEKDRAQTQREYVALRRWCSQQQQQIEQLESDRSIFFEQRLMMIDQLHQARQQAAALREEIQRIRSVAVKIAPVTTSPAPPPKK